MIKCPRCGKDLIINHHGDIIVVYCPFCCHIALIYVRHINHIFDLNEAKIEDDFVICPYCDVALCTLNEINEIVEELTKCKKETNNIIKILKV